MNKHEKISEHLSRDPIMAKLINQFGPFEFRDEVNLFEDLVDTVIYQQLSTKAAGTISKRFWSLYRKPYTPQKIIKTADEKIRACGISFSKISYIKGISKLVYKGKFDPNTLRDLSDQEVIARLVELKGIGPWSAEMFLMFSLQRPDVFSVGDLGLRTAVAKLYKVDREDTEKILRVALKWSPYRTYASRYLWKSLDNINEA